MEAPANDLAARIGFQYIVGMRPLNFKDSKMIIYAPLAGISDSSSRRLARSLGADVAVSELISAEGVIRRNPRTLQMATFHDSERPIGLQIFGGQPKVMAEAARILSILQPDFIDINFGCPARKIVNKNGGSFLLKNLNQMGAIISAVAEATDVPVTVKMRSGWDSENSTYLEAGRIAEESGAVAVTLHPRASRQGFAGRADWSQIRELKHAVKIPVIGNGDISSPQSARAIFETTGCDAIMVGRASLGDPWIFKRIKEFLNSGLLMPEPSPRQRIELALQHLDMAVELYGLPRAVYRMRAQFCWYLKGIPQATRIRSELVHLDSPPELRNLLTTFLQELESLPSPAPQAAGEALLR